MSSSSCNIGRPSLICVCFVWGVVAGWNNYSCTWLAKFLLLLCIEVGRQEPGWNHSYLCLLRTAYVALLHHFPRMPTSACASRHAPCVPRRIAFIIIRPAALCLLIIIIVIGMTAA